MIAETCTANGTLGALPDEVLRVVFDFCDARTRMMTIPAVCKQWLGVRQMHRAAIDLTWAVRNLRFECAITDAGVGGLVRRFPNIQRLDLRECTNVTDGGLATVAAGCPDLQHLNLFECDSVTDGGRRGRGGRCWMRRSPAPRPRRVLEGDERRGQCGRC